MTFKKLKLYASSHKAELLAIIYFESACIKSLSLLTWLAAVEKHFSILDYDHISAKIPWKELKASVMDLS